MTRSGNIHGGPCALLLAMLLPLMAGAQSPPVPAGGNGIKVGDGRLHPYIDLETRVDTGVGYFPDTDTADPNDVEGNLSGEVVLRLRPGLKLDVPSSKVALSASAQLEYVLYTGLLTKGSSYASHLEGAADLTATFNPEGKVGFILADQFARSDQTRNVALGAGILSLYNELRASMPIKPGGGAIEVTPEAGWAVEFFSPLALAVPEGCVEEVCAPLEVENFDYNNLRVGLDGRWRFLPKTAVVLDTDLDFRSYFRGTNPDAVLLRAMMGLAGLVSPKIAVTAKAGWGYDFGASGGNTFIAQLEGNYQFSPTMSFKGGYYRTLTPVATYGLFRDDRLYVDARALFGGKLTLHGYAALDLLNFFDAANPRSDTVVSMDVGPEYQFRPWLVGAAGYLLGTRSSSLAGDGLNYTRHEAYFRLTLVY